MVTLLLYYLVDDEQNTLGLPAIAMTMMRCCNLVQIAQ